MRRVQPFGMAIGLALLGSALAFDVTWMVAVHHDRAFGASASQVLGVPQFRAANGDMGAFTVVLDQPVFHEDRAFHTPPPALMVPATPAVVFVGYMTFPDRPAVVLFKELATGRSVRAQLGQTVDGWKLVHADAQGARLENASFRAEVGRAGTSPTVTPVPAQPAPKPDSARPKFINTRQ